MKLLVLAANGQIARIVTNRILTESTFKEIELTLVLRQASRLAVLADNPRVTIVEGDLTDEALINRVVVGQDFVYIAVVDHGVTNATTKHVIQAMQANGVTRVISTNILGIYGEVPGEFGRWNLSMVESGLQAAIRADQLLATSGLAYTTLRLPWLNDRDEIKYDVTMRHEPFIGVSGSRQSVADLVLKIIADPDYGTKDSLGLADPETQGLDRPVY